MGREFITGGTNAHTTGDSEMPFCHMTDLPLSNQSLSISIVTDCAVPLLGDITVTGGRLRTG